MKLIRRFLCLIGIHEWEFTYRGTRGGLAVGDKCRHCGLWSPKNSVRRAYEKSGA